jgi:hypothetical protein
MFQTCIHQNKRISRYDLMNWTIFFEGKEFLYSVFKSLKTRRLLVKIQFLEKVQEINDIFIYITSTDDLKFYYYFGIWKQCTRR